jgi:hypothetical protein
MKSQFRFGLLVALVALLSLVLSLAVQESAFAMGNHASCSGTGCNGKYASSTGCDGATTVKTAFIPRGTVELRKSSTCSTFWARTTNTGGASYYVNASLAYYYFTNSGAPIANGQGVYSYQRYGISGFKACGGVENFIQNWRLDGPSSQCAY